MAVGGRRLHLDETNERRASHEIRKARGVEFTGPITDRGYGLVTRFKVPRSFEVQLYQPRYAKKAAGK